MHARSALFDVYGDHLRTRGDQAPVAALVRLLDPRRASPPRPSARRSRGWCGRAGWSRSSCAAGRGYRATERADRRLDEAADRIYRRARPELGRPLAPASFVDAARRPRRARPAAGRAGLPRATPSSRDRPGSARSPAPRLTRSSLERAGAPRRAPRAPSTSTRRRPRPGTSARLRGGVRRLAGRPRTTSSARQLGRPRRRRTRRRSPPASSWSTSGASSSSPTPGCPPSCCPRDWPGRAAADCFAARGRPAQAGAPTASSTLPGPPEARGDPADCVP